MKPDVAGLSFLGTSGLHFLRPHWLWLLLALPALAWWWRRRQMRQSVWHDVVDPHLLPHLLQGGSGARRHAGLWLGLSCVGLAVCALAGPSWQRSEQPLWQDRAPLVIALDLSRTSTANDLPPSRLLQARAKVSTLLQQRAGGQVGLVAFADDAYTVAPLTDDSDNVSLFLDALAPDIMPSDGNPGLRDAGSRSDRAIEWSGQLLHQAGFDRGDILVLTDHADSVARDAAAASARAGYRVSALGLGTAQGASYRESDGRIARAQLDGDSLRALATAGQGTYAAVAPDSADLAALGVLDPQRADTVAAQGEKTTVWRDQGYWLLLPVLLLAAFAFRRGGALAAVLLCLCLPLQTAHASGIDWWQRPDQQRHQAMVRGAEAYRSEDYATADNAWHELSGADAAYNRGNALARQSQYDAAIAQYDQALRLQPGMADAIANKQAVEAAKKRKPPSGQQQSKQNNQQGQKGQNRDDQSSKNQGQSGNDNGKQNSGKGGDNPQQRTPGQSASQSAMSDTNQAEKPSDGQAQAKAKAQRQADAAQRARMQQARAEQAKRDGEQGSEKQQKQTVPAKPDETPKQREQRIANESWLRRVPDDPGGLLRARFRLEFERRQQEGR